ncbi:MAG TPA: RdgB/HAM1 family non-canonical purine NTP pyrophosphatase [Balneolaceae bacterium]|nr:RdgB/HAM1 family non-canonical purine NTP pyrophosphatase [Balneolaceae bacterium]
MKKIILASRNEDKIKELRQLLQPFNIELKSALDFSNLGEVVEDKQTLEGNALKKARYVYQKTKLPSLADDTGLEVDALNGRPGVYSARYAEKNASYQENVNKLLGEMRGVPDNERSAQFRTVVALVTEKQEQTFEGICRGKIIKEERGTAGFGYDPIFKSNGYQKTFAELSNGEKNKISHRARALQKFVEWLKG